MAPMHQSGYQRPGPLMTRRIRDRRAAATAVAAAEVAAVLAELDAAKRETLERWSNGDSAPTLITLAAEYSDMQNA
jgi:hypothetical protein